MPSLDPPGGVIPGTPGELTPHWLASVFIRSGFSAAIESIDFRPVEAASLTSQILRVVPRVQDETTGFAPPLLWKRSLDDAEHREVFSRGYAAEVGFYRDLAPGTTTSVPRCFAAAYDEVTAAHVLILEDLSARTTNAIAEAMTPGQAQAVLHELATLHASNWTQRGTPRSAEAFSHVGASVEQRASASIPFLTEHVDDRVGDRTGRYVVEVAALSARLARGPQARTHGDLHPGNVLLPVAATGRPILVDWQCTSIAAPMQDVARLLALGLSTEDRRAHEGDLLAEYLDQLAVRGSRYDPAIAARDYRTALMLQWGWTIASVRHERLWDRDTRAAMLRDFGRTAAAFDDAQTWFNEV